MLKKILSLIKLIRPRQWIKNLAVFAAAIFAGEFFEPNIFQNVLLAFVAFCMLSSATYIINDAFDVKKDKLHPFKRFRPLAHGDMPIYAALIIATQLICFSLIIGLLINTAFLIISIIYVFIQLFYSTILKSIAVADILAIASGYILRVYAGELYASNKVGIGTLTPTQKLNVIGATNLSSTGGANATIWRVVRN